MWRKSLFGWHLVTSWTVVSAQLVIQQRLSAHRSPHRVSKSQWRAVPHISRWWHFHGERRVEWAASDQIRHRVEKPGDVALSPGERTGGSRVCQNHLLGCLSCAGPLLWCQRYPSGCASLTGVTLRRGERTTVAGHRIVKVPAPSPPPPLPFWSTRHRKSWFWVGSVLLKLSACILYMHKCMHVYVIGV